MLSTILYHTEPSRLLVTTNSVSEDAYMSVYLPGLVLVRLSTASHRCLGMTATKCDLFCFPEAVLGLESLCFPPGGGGGVMSFEETPGPSSPFIRVRSEQPQPEQPTLVALRSPGSHSSRSFSNSKALSPTGGFACSKNSAPCIPLRKGNNRDTFICSLHACSKCLLPSQESGWVRHCSRGPPLCV